MANETVIMWLGIGLALILGIAGFLNETTTTGTTDDTSWISLTQKLNTTGDVDENISIVTDGYIINNGTHLIIGSS